MKVRSDFVTNSSSSSFIIAKNSKCTVDEIRNNLKEHTEEIKAVLGMFDDCDNSTLDIFIEELCMELFDRPGDLKLGDWSASAVEYNNENGVSEAFMYDFGCKLGTENFKVG